MTISGRGWPIHFAKPMTTISSLALVVAAQCEIDYRVMVDPSTKRVEVRITAPSKRGQISFQIPNWMPGHYVLDNFYKDVHDVSAVDPKGRPLAVDHPDLNTWTVQSPVDGPVTLSYWVPVGVYKRFARPNDDSFVQLAGAVNYMYVVGRKAERCKITYDLPTGWPALTGLDPASGDPNSFVAPTYDVLADNPLSTGQVTVDRYRLRGKDHFIVLEGARDLVDRQKLIQYCRFVSAAETDFFRNAPYHRYVWHFIVNPGFGTGGGLEHLSGTQIGLGSALIGPGIESFLGHEYFHLWNVKRIRSKVLGPFDYLNLPKTGALWWLEGVTDYYASLLPYRYGKSSREGFLNTIVRTESGINRNPARLEVSPYQSSFRLDESSGARGNSGSNGGYKISFYSLGWLCGFCLDTEIRSQTAGKHSLDDVIRALYDLCKNSKPGFEEDEIRKQCVRFGGTELGPFYDRIVMTPGELHIEDQLAKVGLKVRAETQTPIASGFLASPNSDGTLTVRMLRGTAAEGKLQIGDRINSINGVVADKVHSDHLVDVMRELESHPETGPQWVLAVSRGDQALSVTIEPVKSTDRQVSVVYDDPSASPQAIALREQWLKVIRPTEE